MRCSFNPTRVRRRRGTMTMPTKMTTMFWTLLGRMSRRIRSVETGDGAECLWAFLSS